MTSSEVPAYTPCPTDGQPCKILPLGDSITEGCCPGNGGYRIQLFHRALEDGKNITFVGSQQNGPNMVDNQPFPRNHEGRGGYTIAGPGVGPLAGPVTDNAMTMYQPHIVLLMVGTNDLNGNFDVNNAPSRLGSLMDDIIAFDADALLAVASIIPMENGNGSKVGPYNAAIVELVEERANAGKHVIFVDNHAAFTSNANYASQWMSDTLHPNTAGYVPLGDSYYDAIAEYLIDK